LMRNAARAVAEALPNGRRSTLADQTHDLSPDATAAAVKAFLASRDARVDPPAGAR
jgi:hypothetical protein